MYYNKQYPHLVVFLTWGGRDCSFNLVTRDHFKLASKENCFFEGSFFMNIQEVGVTMFRKKVHAKI